MMMWGGGRGGVQVVACVGKVKDAMEAVGSHRSFLVTVRGSWLLPAIADFFCMSQTSKNVFN